MFLQILKSLLIFLVCTAQLSADDKVSNWLGQMGCNDLLALYLEQQLQDGTTQSKVEAAEQLATLYAYMLSQSTGSDDDSLLERANALLESIPQANTVDLRLQLLRASYLASELTFEKYRLRLIDSNEAQQQALVLEETSRKLESLRTSLLRKAKNSRNFSTKDSSRLGVATSLSAWAKYYLAWFKQDKTLASEAADIFATILEGDEASLQDISLDLRKEEFGARALLGITLCKNINNIAGEQYTWLEELAHDDTWAGIKQQIPMWTIMMQVDSGEWDKVKTVLTDPLIILEPHTLRLAAVQGIESSIGTSKEVASIAIGQLINESELGIVSQLIEKHGYEIVSSNAFISKYLEGELHYRNAKALLDGDEPSDNSKIVQQFQKAANTLTEAVHSANADEYPVMKDDCIYLIGLAHYFSRSFVDASTTFYQLGKRTTSEKALWMSIVALEEIVTPTPQSAILKSDAVKLYTNLWPNSQKTTQLKLHYPSELADQSTIEDLLTIQPSDVNYSNARRKASRLLYEQWGKAKPIERGSIGNTYVGVVLPIILEDSKSTEQDAKENALVRTLRLLEVTLHSDIQRLVAANQAFETFQSLALQGIDTTQFDNEVRYRKIIYSVKSNQQDNAIAETVSFLHDHPDDRWAKHAAIYSWNTLTTEDTSPNNQLLEIGLFILDNVYDEELSAPKYLNVSKLVAEQILLQAEMHQDNHLLERAHQIAIALFNAYPNSHEVLRVNALTESALGNIDRSITHWNTILDASASPSEGWLEAKYNIALLLSEHNKDKAILMLNQFAALYPDYGSGRFASKIKALHESLEGGKHGS